MLGLQSLLAAKILFRTHVTSKSWYLTCKLTTKFFDVLQRLSQTKWWECAFDIGFYRVDEWWEWHARHECGWLTATACMVCGRVTHFNGSHGMRACWLMGNGMSYIMQNNTNLSDNPCVPVGVWVIGPRYTCLSGKGWVIGPRYAWLTSNCIEIGVIGCKLCPFL